MPEDLRAIYKQRFDFDLEQEDYEIRVVAERLGPDRREFLKTLGGGLLFLVTARGQGRELPARIHVASDGVVTALTGKMDMGQGSRTLLSQAVAEEMGVPLEKVRLMMGDTDLCPDDGGTWASLTTPQTVPLLRKAAAEVRARLNGGASPHLTDPAYWRILGRTAPNLNGREIVTGRKEYATDLNLERGLHACAVRSPHHRAKLVSFDASTAQKLPGVRIVRDGDLVGVLAPSLPEAREAARLVRAEWAPEPVPPESEWEAQFRKTAVEPVEQPDARYPPLVRRGDAFGALKAATRVKKSSYWVSPIAHVPMEPRAALAEWNDGRLTIRSGAQAPFLVRQELARALGVAEERIRLIVSDSGGAFGGKQHGECELEAARLARATGVPVKLAWSREEEFTCAYTRPAGLLEVESAVDESGRFTAYRFSNYNSGPAGITPQYALPNLWAGFYRTKSFVRQGSYRSLAAAANNFARESHAEEWAAELNMDPLEFRLRNISDARLKEVLERTAARFGWGKRKPGNGAGFGLSCNLEKEARLALFVEVEMTGAELRIRRMTATGDFGAALNPDALKNQMTGAIIQGIGGALWERVAFENGAQKHRRLSGYRVPRFRDVPAMDVEIIDRRAIPSAGAGESPITLTAPALGAALFAASGRRIRSLPLLAPLSG